MEAAGVVKSQVRRLESVRGSAAPQTGPFDSLPLETPRQLPWRIELPAPQVPTAS